MRRRVWTAAPWFLIFSLAMLGMAAMSYRYSRELFLAELGLGIVTIAVVVFSGLSFKRYVSRTVSRAVKNVLDGDHIFLEHFKIPVVLTGKHGDILWSNLHFKKQLCGGRNPANDSVAPYIADKEVDSVADGEGFDIDLDGRHYTVYCNAYDEGFILFYIDNTNFVEIRKRFNDTRKSVALIMFDNREEFTNDSEEESARVLLTLETKLLHFADENGALFKSLPSNRYMMIFDQSALNRQISDKFPILKDIRTIRFNNREATISVGIGMGNDTLVESERQARKALDMALGRGGDQVAVMKNGNYEFFGGVSAGVERTTKVRTRVIATSIARTITESDRVLIMGHRFSDLDSVGAAVGLKPIIEKGYRKYCRIAINKETSMAKSLIDLVEQENKDVFITPEEALRAVSSRTLLIIVDTHLPDVVESPELLKKCKRVIVIDHHRKMVNFIDNSIVFYHEPTASSASEMVAELATYLGENYLGKLEAEALLSGIMLDTKSFVVRTGVRTFEAAAFLRKKGADTVETKQLFASSLEVHKQKYNIVSNAKVVGGCAVAVTDEQSRNIRLIAAQAADELLTVENVAASFVVFKTGELINVSARSFGKLNVQLVMELLGGGGHRNMAAAQLRDVSVAEVEKKLVEAITKIRNDA